MPLGEIKVFNEPINNKPLFDQPIKDIGLYHRKRIRLLVPPNYYKFIGINLSRQANTSIPQQINFMEKLEEDDGVTMFFITEKK